jgi:hypothetical protein
METKLIYIGLSIVISILIGVAKALPRPPESRSQVNEGIAIVVLSFIFNIIYTGFLGWHSVAGSTLEWVLDILDGIAFYYGIYLMFADIRFSKIKR